MIYTRKKNPKILDFFCRKKWNFRGVLLAKKKRFFCIKKKKKSFTENREKTSAGLPNVFWRRIRYKRPLGKKRHFFPQHNHEKKNILKTFPKYEKWVTFTRHMPWEMCLFVLHTQKKLNEKYFKNKEVPHFLVLIC